MRDFVQRQREAREHGAWFRAKAQEALGDPRPGIPRDVVMHEAGLNEIRAVIDRIAAGKIKAWGWSGTGWPA